MENDGTMPPRPGALSVTAYAKHRRIGESAVRYAIQTGRLDGAILKGEKGRWWIVSAVEADKLWDANRRPKLPSRTRESRTEQIPGAGSSVEGDGLAGGMTPYQASRAERERAAAAREAANAELAQIDLALRRGEVIDAVEARAAIADMLTTVKVRLLALPIRIGQQIPEVGPAGVKLIDKIVRDALESLSNELA